MSIQGTWADHIVIQAVADSLNLRIHIVESNANFSDLTLVNTETGNIRYIQSHFHSTYFACESISISVIYGHLSIIKYNLTNLFLVLIDYYM